MGKTGHAKHPVDNVVLNPHEIMETSERIDGLCLCYATKCTFTDSSFLWNFLFILLSSALLWFFVCPGTHGHRCVTRPGSSAAPLALLTGQCRAIARSQGPLLDTCERRRLRQAAQSSSPTRGNGRCRHCFGAVAHTEEGCRACREHVHLHVRRRKVRRKHATEQQRNAVRLSPGGHGPSLCFPLRVCCRLLDASVVTQSCL